MNRPFAARGVVISLVVLVGVAALIWWLLASGRFDSSLTPTASKAPADQSKPRVSAPATEKPAVHGHHRGQQSDQGSRRPARAIDAIASRKRGFGAGIRRCAGRAERRGCDRGSRGRRTPRSNCWWTVRFTTERPRMPPVLSFSFRSRCRRAIMIMTLRATAPDGKVMVSKSGVAVAVVATDVPPVAALTAPHRQRLLRQRPLADRRRHQAARRRGVETGIERRRPADRIGRS